MPTTGSGPRVPHASCRLPALTCVGGVALQNIMRDLRHITLLPKLCHVLQLPGVLQKLRNQAAYQALLTWHDWAAERGELRQLLQRAVVHWHYMGLSMAFHRFRWEQAVKGRPCSV